MFYLKLKKKKRNVVTLKIKPRTTSISCELEQQTTEHNPRQKKTKRLFFYPDFIYFYPFSKNYYLNYIFSLIPFLFWFLFFLFYFFLPNK